MFKNEYIIFYIIMFFALFIVTTIIDLLGIDGYVVRALSYGVVTYFLWPIRNKIRNYK